MVFQGEEPYNMQPPDGKFAYNLPKEDVETGKQLPSPFEAPYHLAKDEKRSMWFVVLSK